MIRPLRDYIVVKPFPRKLSDVLLVIADRNKERPNVDAAGEVVAVGPGRRAPNGSRVPLDVFIGDTIRFEEHKTYPKFGDLMILQQADVAIIDGTRHAA